ncbi:hypothetical protein BCD67_03380 [Oscillatoriales cyanobacterium USR001]|nr:hypothetical protein BCD67_03380 [Oscillatoriales cyanobacterium USR001]
MFSLNCQPILHWHEKTILGKNAIAGLIVACFVEIGLDLTHVEAMARHRTHVNERYGEGSNVVERDLRDATAVAHFLNTQNVKGSS